MVLVGGAFTGIGNEPRTALAALPKEAPPVSCAPTDISPISFDLKFSPETLYGHTRFEVNFRNLGTSATNEPILTSLYELDDTYDRVRLVLQQSYGNTNVLPGHAGGLGGYSNDFTEGSIYEFDIAYPCDTNASNNSIFQFAYSSVSPDVVFRAGMESPPALPATSSRSE